MKVITDAGVIEIGTTEAAPTIGLTDYSRRETDDFGVTTVVKRNFSRTMSVRVMVPTANVDALQRQLAALRAKPVQWVADDRFDSLSIIGFYKDLSINLAIPPVSYCTLTIEGLAEGADYADPGTDPATDQRKSTLRLLRPASIDDAVLTSSNVPENDYPAWSASATYALGARVILSSTHRIYESAANGNVGNDPTGTAGQWIDIAPTNRWAMFDQALGSQTERASSIVVSLDPIDPIDAVALLDVTAASVRVQAAGYDRTLSPAIQPGAVTFLDLPATAGAVVITISGSGTVSVGTLLIGKLLGLGTTEASPTAAITDYSRKETDAFGDVTVVERAWAKRMDVKSLISTAAVDVVAARIANVRAMPVLWIGDATLESLAIYGFFKDFSIAVDEHVSTLSLSIEGLSTAAKLAPLGADVSWSDIKDDDPAHPKPEDGATVGATPEQVEQIADAQFTADAAAVAVAAAQAQIAAIESSVSADFSEVNAALSTLNGEVDTAQSNIAALQSADSAIQQSVGLLQNDMSSALGSIGTINGEIDGLESQAAGIIASVSGLDDQIVALGGDISTIETVQASHGSSISTLQQTASNQAGELAQISTDLSTANANISQNAQAISATNGNVASLSSTVSTQGGAISDLQSVTTTQGGTIAQHTSDIATANASISTNAQAISTANGNIASLSSRVGTAEASISTNANAISTVAGNLATLTTRVSANGANLLPNGGLGNGFGNASGWGNFGYDDGQFWGPTAYTVTAGRQVFSFNTLPCNPGTTYTIHCDPLASAPGCFAYCDLLFYDASGQMVLDGPQNPQNGPYDFSVSDDRRALIAVTATAPATAVRMAPRFVGFVANGGTVGFRRMKVEIGAQWTRFSDEASITQAFSAMSTLNSSYASLQTRVSTAEGNVTTLQSSLTSANGSISTLQTNVSSLSGAVSTLQSSSTTQAGQISTLESTVASQGATISSNSQAITTLQGSLATLSNVVNASSNPNLIPGIEIGLTGWYGDGFSRTTSGGWGTIAYRNSPFTGLVFLDSPIVPAWQFKAYTAAADSSFFTTGTGSTRVEILFKDSAGNLIGNPQSQSRYAAPNVDFADDGSSRATLTASGYAPAGTVSAQVRLTAQLDSGAMSGLGWRQVKLEQGTVASPYSGEASAAQTFQAFSDLNGSVASLSSTVSTQGGSISTLQSSYTGLNGTVATLQSTVSAQGGSISNLQTVQSTHTGQIAMLSTQVVSGGGNLLQNTDFAVSTTGWSFNQEGTAHSGGRDLLGDNYRPLNEHNIAIYHSNNNGADYAYWAADRVAIVPGKIYEFSAGIANSRANCVLYLRYVYGDGSVAQDFTVAKNYFSEGRLLENFPTFFVRGQAPAGAWWVECLLLKFGTSPGYGDSYAWFVRPQLVEVPGLAGGPVAYSPGGTAAMISAQASAISSATGQLSSLQTTVSTQGTQVDNLQTAYSGLNGTVATLQSTVSAHGASISTLQSATATLEGNVATLTTRVSSAGGNMLPNGGLENGFNTGVSDTGGFNFYTGGWGPIAQTTANGLHVFYFNPVENPQIGAQYTVAMDPLNFGSSDIYCNIVCVDSAGNVLLDGTPGVQISGGDFSTNDDRRARSACTVTVPSNTARLIVRAYGTVRDGQPIGFRRVKLERGSTWSPYSAEASITQTFSTLSTLSTQYASLSSTVATQGASISSQATAITTLQGNYASLSSTVSTLNASVATQQSAITDLQGRTSAYWQVTAVAGGRAQLRVYADSNGGGGVDIVGDLRVTGNVLIDGTVNPEALALQRFVKRLGPTSISATNSIGSLYSGTLGQTLANGSYLLEGTVGFTYTCGRQTRTYNGKPYYIDYLNDGGVLVRLYKNGNLIASTGWSGPTQTSYGSMAYGSAMTTNFDAPAADTLTGDVTIEVVSFKGNVDTDIVNQGDYYTRQVSGSYSNFSFSNLKLKWTFI